MIPVWERLAAVPVWLNVGLGMVIASMVGYLGEVAATKGVAAVFSDWNLMFVLLGLLAAALSAGVWGA